jgi:RNA polymerase sigma-70 factor (ECF subfamily)
MPQDEVDDRDIGELEDQKAPLPSAPIEKAEMVTAVRGALAEMDEMHRLVLELRFMDDLSYADIAAAMDVSIGTVMSRLFNAKRKLQRIMREQKQ